MSALSSKPSLQKTVDDIQDCVNKLKSQFNDGGEPINDDNTILQRLCVKLEFLLQHNLIEHSSFLSGKKNYWNYFFEGLASTKGVNDGLKFVKSLSELKTNLGRGRAFVRFCLMYQRLADCIQLCTSNHKLLSQWYTKSSVWHDPNLSNYLVSILYDLNSLTFDLGAKGYDLDNGWPSFSKQGQGQITQKWDIISRTSSMTSLSQSFATGSPRMSSSFLQEEEEPESDMVKKLEQSERSKVELEQSLSAAENRVQEMDMTHQSTVTHLSEQIQALEKRISEAFDESSRLKMVSDETIGQLQAKLSEQKELANQKEQNLTLQINDLEKDINDKMLKLRTALVNEASWEAKDTQKTSIINDLELKVSNLEARNANLLEKMQQIAESKSAQATVQMDSVQKMESLLQNVADLESAKRLTTDKLGLSKQNAAALEEQLGQEKSDKLQLCADIATAQEQRKKLESELCDQQLKIGELETDATSQRNILETLEADYAELQRIHSLAHEENLMLKNEQEKSAAKMSNAQILYEKQSVELRESMASAESLTQSLREEMEGLHSQLVGETRLSEERQTLLEQTSSSLVTMQSKVSDLTLQLDESGKKVDDLTSKVSKLTSDLTGSQQELNLSRNECKEMDEKLGLVTDTLENTSESLNKAENEISELVIKLRDAESAQEIQFKEAADAAQKYETDLAILKTKTDEQTNLNLVMFTEMNSLKKSSYEKEALQQSRYEAENSTNKNLQTQISALDTELQENKINIKKLKTESDRKTATINELEDSVQNLSKEKESLLDERLQMRESQSTLQGQLDDQCETLKGREGQIQSLQDQMKKQEGQLKELNNRNDDGLNSISILQANLDEKNSDIEDCKVKIVELQTALERQASAAVMNETETQQKLAQVYSERDQLAAQLRSAETEQISTSKVIDEMTLQKEALQTRLESVENEKDVLSTTQCTVRDEIEELRTNLKSLKQQEVDKSSELSDVQGKLEATRLEWTNQQSIMEQQLNALRFQLSSQQMEGDIVLQGYKEQQAEVYTMGQTIAAQERLIVSIEMQLESLQDERTFENEVHFQQLAELSKMLDDKESELADLTDELKACNMISEKASSSYQKMSEEIINLKLENTERLAVNENEMHQMREDNMMLRKRLIKLIKDKDSLWKKTDELVFKNRVKSDVKWIESGTVYNCMGCRAQFSLMLRKHHCRLCGRVFCWQCSNNWLDTVSSSKKSRACNQCFIEHSHEPIDSVNSASLVDENQDAEELSLPADIDTRQWRTDSNSLNSPVEVVSPSQQIPSAASLPQEIEIDDEARETISPLQSTFHHPNSHHEDFEEITDEEVARSLGESAELSRSINRSITSPVEVTSPWESLIHSSQLTEHMTQVQISAGKSYTVCVNVACQDLNLSWEFSTQPKSIMFQVTYQSELCSNEEDVIPLCKCNSHKKSITGEMVAHNPGYYIFKFDNTSSMYLSKTLQYKIYTDQ